LPPTLNITFAGDPEAPLFSRASRSSTPNRDQGPIALGRLVVNFILLGHSGELD